MSTSNIDVCNEALGMLGAQSIQSFDDGSENARRCASIYNSTRRALLRLHPWSFAKKRVKLSPLADQPSFGYMNAFPLPSDFIRLYDTGAQEFEVEGKFVLANTDVIYLVYVSDNNVEATWDTLFSECMSLYLMKKLAKPITGSQAESDSALAMLQNTLKQARSINGQERPSQDFDANFQSTLVGVRY